MNVVEVVSVFVGPRGQGGNLLGIVIDGTAAAAHRGQQLAADLGFSEVVYVDDPANGVVRIFTPRSELPFAGHPLVGTAWLLSERGFPLDVLRPPAGEVRVHHDGDIMWIEGRVQWSPPMALRQLSSPADVEGLTAGQHGPDPLYTWAWVDERAGVVRARFFAPTLGIPEDEATGSAAIRLGDELHRALVIRQGQGSEITVRPGPAGVVAVGGRVQHVETRRLPVWGGPPDVTGAGA